MTFDQLVLTCAGWLVKNISICSTSVTNASHDKSIHLRCPRETQVERESKACVDLLRLASPFAGALFNRDEGSVKKIKSINKSKNIIDLMQIWRLLISINWTSSTKELSPITRKSVSKLVTLPSFRCWRIHAE